jgi:hypothetical protein
MNMKRIITISIASALLALPLLAQKAPDAKDVRRSVIVRGDRVDVVGDAEGPRRIFIGGGGGYLGIAPVAMTGDLRSYFGVADDAGVLVGEVFPDGPAAKAGLRVGDIVTRVDGRKVASTFDIGRALGAKKKGDQVRIDYVRDRAPQHLFVSVDERRGGSSFEFRFPELPEISIDRAELEKMIDGAKSMALAPEARARVFALGANCDELQERIKELELRLKELEKRLK